MSSFVLGDWQGPASGLASSPTSAASFADAVASDPVLSGEDYDLVWLANHVTGPQRSRLDAVGTPLLTLYSRALQDASNDTTVQAPVLSSPLTFDLFAEKINGTPYAKAYNTDGTRPVVQVYVDDVASAAPELEALGMQVTATTDRPAWQVVAGYLPLSSLGEAAQLDSVRHIQAVERPVLNGQGSALNQWEAVTSAHTLKGTLGVDGTGIDIGVISDTIDRVGGGISDSVASGDLPGGNRVTVVADDVGESNPTDEGRGMAELIYDIGEGFDILFHTGTISPANMAGAYEMLREAGADVIVDDVGWFNEPVFQDGIISQAIDDVYLDHGVLVFGAAGNQDGRGYVETWSDSDNDGKHNFDGFSEGVEFELDDGDSVTVSLHWSQPWGVGSLTDLDIEIWQSGNKVADSNDFNVLINSYDSVTFTNETGSDGTFSIILRETLLTSADGLTLAMVVRPSKSNSGPLRITSDWFPEHDPSMTGDALSKWMYAIGAANYLTPDSLEGFSSYGPGTIFFDDAGNPLESPEIREKPDFVAVDGVDTSFFGSGDSDGSGLTNFFGTSAAAPNAAAVAGLLLDLAGGPDSLTYTAMSNLLAATATGPGAGSWDAGWGEGRIDALAAGLMLDGYHSRESTIELNQEGDWSSDQSFAGESDLDVYALAVPSTETTHIDVTTDFGLEPDDYASGTLLETVNPNVTFSASGDVKSAIFDGATTGNQVIGRNDDIGWVQDEPLWMEFAQPVSRVAIDFIGDVLFGKARGKLWIYDSADNVIGFRQSALLSSPEAQTLTLQRPVADIHKAVVQVEKPDDETGNVVGGWDNLRFGVDPAIAVWNRTDNALEDIVLDADANDLHDSRSLATGKVYHLEAVTQSALDGGTPYTISIDAPAPSSSTLTPNLFGDTSTTGTLGVGAADYYEVTTPGGSFSGDGFISLTPASTLDGVLTLFDAAGSEVFREDTSGLGGSETINVTGLAAGQTYFVRVGSHDYATTGPYNLAVNFDVPSPPNGRILGRLVDDVNGNGVQDGGEGGLSNWVVFLDQDQNGQLDAGEQSTLTDSNGDYEFDGLVAGDYYVTLQNQNGWTQTAPFANGGFESGTLVGWDAIGEVNIQRSNVGVSPTDGSFQVLLTTAGDSVNQAKLETFSDYLPGALDETGAGNAAGGSAIRTIVTVQDGTELSWDWNFLTNQSTPSQFNDFAFQSVLPTPGLGSPNDVFADTNSAFVPSATVFKEETGYQTFSGTFGINGTFAITLGVVDEDSFLTTSGLLIDNLKLTPPGGAVPPGTHKVTILGPTHIVSGRDFASRPTLPTEVRGVKFHDLDNDGVQDGAEPGLPGWTIYADLNHNGHFDGNEPFDVTDADGNYALIGLLPDNYVIAEVPAEGWEQTSPPWPGVRITEVDPGGPDFVEIQNLSLDAVDTSGWQVVVSDSYTNINAANTTTWALPASLAAGSTHYRTDNSADKYWGSNILWNPGSNGWAMILDNIGEVVDWVGWGWSHAQILTFDAAAGGFSNVQLGSAWAGDSLSDQGTGTVQRLAVADTNVAGDFAWVTPESKGEPNTGMGGPSHIVELLPEQVYLDRKFGNALPGVVSGRKFNDLNGNGQLDGVENGLSGWKIYVDLDRDQVHDEPVSLEPDDYPDATVVNSVVPEVDLSAVGSGISGSDDVTATVTSNVSTGTQAFRSAPSVSWLEGSRELRGDFAHAVARVSIDFISDDSSDVGQLDVYDANDNLLGTYVTDDLGTGQFETMTIRRPTADIGYFKAFGRSGQTGNLDNLVFGTTEPFDTTDGGGNYQIDQLPLLELEVREEPQTGWAVSQPLGGVHLVELTHDVPAQSNLDFGNFESGRIAGTKFYDQNADGLRNPGEHSLADWFIYIDENTNGQFDPGEEATITDANGQYLFDDLLAGNYAVGEFHRPRWQQSAPAGVTLDQWQLDGSSVLGAIHSKLTVGQTVTVGQSGTLAGVELALTEQGTGGDLLLEILDFSGGDLSAAPVLGSVPVAETEIGAAPSMLQFDATTATYIDLSSLAISVADGDALALRLTTSRALPDLYAMRRLSSDVYPEGSYFSGTTLHPSSDVAFKLFLTGDAAPPHQVGLSPGEIAAGRDFANTTENLLQNGSGEQPLVLGEIPFWTETVGSNWTYRSSSPEPKHEGSYFFAGAGAAAELTQDIDLSEYASNIDAGTQQFLMQGFVRSYSQTNPDSARIVVEYRDSSTVLETFDSGEITNTSDWQLVSDERFAPPGTELVRIRLISTRHSGTNNDGYFDNLIFVAHDVHGPVAIAEADPTDPERNEEISFDASRSQHGQPQGAVDSYQWDFDYNGTTFEVDATGAEVSHAYTSFGSRIAALRVTDDDPTSPKSDIATIAFDIAAPTTIPGDMDFDGDTDFDDIDDFVFGLLDPVGYEQTWGVASVVNGDIDNDGDADFDDIDDFVAALGIGLLADPATDSAHALAADQVLPMEDDWTSMQARPVENATHITTDAARTADRTVDPATLHAVPSQYGRLLPTRRPRHAAPSASPYGASGGFASARRGPEAVSRDVPVELGAEDGPWAQYVDRLMAAARRWR